MKFRELDLRVSKMGSGDWIRTITNLKKAKDDCSGQSKGSSTKMNGFKWKNGRVNISEGLADGLANPKPAVMYIPMEDLAATRIQLAFRGYRARKAVLRMKAIERLKLVSQNYAAIQAESTLNQLYSSLKLQHKVRARKSCKLTEGRLRQKKQGSLLKLDAKLHDLEVTWCGGMETMEQFLSKIRQKEAASARRERALSYAFSHQWRAKSGQNKGPAANELGKSNWGWTWKEPWIATRPGISDVPLDSFSPKKLQTKESSNKVIKKSTLSPMVRPPKLSNNDKGSNKAQTVLPTHQRRSYA